MEALLANYEQDRQKLIAKERERSIHHIGRGTATPDELTRINRLTFRRFKHAELTSLEKTAVEHFTALRSKEHASIWNDEATPDIFHGMPFTSSKPIIEKSELFKAIKDVFAFSSVPSHFRVLILIILLIQMPKGALLHCHLDATNSPQNLLALALSLNPTLCISSTTSLAKNPSASSLSTVLHPTLPILLIRRLIRIHAEQYTDGDWVPAQVARMSFVPPPEVKEYLVGETNEELFDSFALPLLALVDGSIGIGKAHEYPMVDRSTFLAAHGLLHYDAVYEAYIEQVFESFAQDNVPYAECRINFLEPHLHSSTGSLLPHRDWLVLFQKALDNIRSSSNRTPEHPFWGARIIYSTIRFIEKGEGEGKLRWYLRDCLELKKEFPDLIAGFDLVGWEDGLHPLSYYMEDLLWFQHELQKDIEPSLRVPFLFHAGETLGDGSKADLNLYDAMLLDTKRIGHGFSLPQHPLLMEMCKEKKIAVEICPISNELLRYTTNGMTHPVSALLNSNVPVSLSCDDPQVFGNPGLSYDFYQVYTSSEQMDILGLGKVARQSIEFSMMPSEEKDARLTEWDAQFDAFLKRSVEKF